MAGVSVSTGAWKKNRKACFLDNDLMRVAILPGGGHIASLTLKSGPAAGINPLWEVPWPSMEPNEFVPSRDLDAYGGPPEGRLLASIMGHNLCLDIFGPPSKEEEAAGLTVHGEAGVAMWDFAEEKSPDAGARIAATVDLPYARLRLRRSYSLPPDSSVLRVETEVENLSDRETRFGWQEHATFGPPFIEGGVTVFEANAKWGCVDPNVSSKFHRLKAGAEFAWPNAPGTDGNPVDLRVFPAARPSSDFTTQLMDATQDTAWFNATNPRLGLCAGYTWHRADFPWLGNWEENYGRDLKPWSLRTLTRGLEFGMSPFAHGRDKMIALGVLQGAPALCTLAPRARKSATFFAFLSTAKPRP
jgi:hypothetical protein